MTTAGLNLGSTGHQEIAIESIRSLQPSILRIHLGLSDFINFICDIFKYEQILLAGCSRLSAIKH